MRKRHLPTIAITFLATAAIALAVIPLSANAASNTHQSTHMRKPLTTTHEPHFYWSRNYKAPQAPGAGNNLVYNGGPVMEGTTQAYLIFWEPTGSTVSATYNSLIERYFADVNGSGLYANNSQYTDSTGNAPTGVNLAGTWVDTSPYPSSSLQDSDVQNEVTNAMNTNSWTADNTHIFFVYTALNENICSGSQCSFSTFCAYHNYFGTNTIYAAMPYDGTDLSGCGPLPNGSPNSDAAADAEISTTSHEEMEAATDPLITAWIDSSGQEIGDKCAYNYGQTNSDGSNVNWNSNPYIVQQEWDNAQSGCVLTGP